MSSRNSRARKPPVEHQFKPGQSGNPAGRPRGIPNLSVRIRNSFEGVMPLPAAIKEAIVNAVGEDRNACGHGQDAAPPSPTEKSVLRRCPNSHEVSEDNLICVVCGAEFSAAEAEQSSFGDSAIPETCHSASGPLRPFRNSSDWPPRVSPQLNASPPDVTSFVVDHGRRNLTPG